MTSPGPDHFRDTAYELRERLLSEIQRFADEKGLTFDRHALGQSTVDLQAGVADVMMFGLNVWPGDKMKSRNVVPFKMPKAHIASAARSLSRVANVVGAVVGTTLLAAASTETVSFPGLSYIAETVYRNNMPATYDRIVEQDGVFFRYTLGHYSGEPHDVVHLVRAQRVTRTELAELGLASHEQLVELDQ